MPAGEARERKPRRRKGTKPIIPPTPKTTGKKSRKRPNRGLAYRRRKANSKEWILFRHTVLAGDHLCYQDGWDVSLPSFRLDSTSDLVGNPFFDVHELEPIPLECMQDTGHKTLLTNQNTEHTKRPCPKRETGYAHASLDDILQDPEF